MGFINATFVADFESRMRRISDNAYDTLNRDLWWPRVGKETPLQSKKEILIWLLDTAVIRYVNRLGGEVNYDDILSQQKEIVYKAATAGLKLNRFQMSDWENGVEGGEALRLGAHWAREMGAYSAYWPQKQVAAAVRDGEQAASLAYDGVVFFKSETSGHPVNPFDPNSPVYANLFTGAASGAYPGALKIDDSVTLDVAIQNVGKAIAYIQSIKMPNGQDPRNLKVRALMGPPALTTRIQQICNAKFIAQAAATGGGGADVEAVIRNWGFAEPIEATELGAGFTNGDNTSWYLVVEDILTSELGGIIYGNREAFNIVYHDGMSDAELLRANELEWVLRGANTVDYGHPYLLFKAKAA